MIMLISAAQFCNYSWSWLIWSLRMSVNINTLITINKYDRNYFNFLHVFTKRNRNG